MVRPRLLIARAEPEASFTTELVARLGGEPILAPMRKAICIQTLAPPKPMAIVATSARAFLLGESIPPDWCDLPCLVVGEITGEAAREAGFYDIRIAQGEATSLAPLLVQFSGKALVYLAGEPRRPELEADAIEHGIPLVSWLRYRMEDAESLPEAARQALVDSQCDAILHFSRESVATLLRLV
ncbi:MAG: uroporphyrinogen-III synthase, partial [Rhabdaerophilum sp.]